MKILRQSRASESAFTMAELALCIAVVAIAMVAIIGVLPLGMNVQKQNKEDTIINQDAQILLDAIRTASASGTTITNFQRNSLDVANLLWGYSNAADYLTNFVDYVVVTNVFGKSYWRGPWYLKETGGEAGDPSLPALMDGHLFLNALLTPRVETNSNRFITNTVWAQMRPITSPVSDYPASLNQKTGPTVDQRFDHLFRYIVTAEVGPALPVHADLYEGLDYERVRQLTNCVYELRLTFQWPVTAQVPDIHESGTRPYVGPNRRTFRTILSGNLETKVIRNSANRIVAAEIPGANPARVPLREFKPSVFVQAPPL